MKKELQEVGPSSGDQIDGGALFDERLRVLPSPGLSFQGGKLGGGGGGNKCETAGAQTDRRNYVRMKPIIKCGCPATIARARRMVGRDDSAISVDTFFLETFFPPFDDKKCQT